MSGETFGCSVPHVHIITSDVNLQTKLSARGLPVLDADA